MMKPVTLVIAVTEEGQVRVEGPITDLVLSYGLLEVAKQIIREEAEKNKLIRPAAAVPPFQRPF